MPVELAVGLKKNYSWGLYFFGCFEQVYNNFTYKDAGKPNMPHKAYKVVTCNDSGHVPEKGPAWEILMDLIDITKLVVLTKFSEESVSYF